MHGLACNVFYNHLKLNVFARIKTTTLRVYPIQDDNVIMKTLHNVDSFLPINLFWHRLQVSERFLSSYIVSLASLCLKQDFHPSGRGFWASSQMCGSCGSTELWDSSWELGTKRKRQEMKPVMQCELLTDPGQALSGGLRKELSLHWPQTWWTALHGEMLGVF